MSWHSGTEYLDSLVKDYLTARRLNNTLKALESDLKNDKDKGFRVDKVVQHLLQFIHLYDIDGLISYWSHLKETFFSRFARQKQAAVEKYEADLYRLYMVYAAQNSKQKELQAFFQKVSDLEIIPGLKDWYVLMFTSTPEAKANFAPYFTRQWSETFIVSLRNLLSAVFSCMPEPDLVRACIDDGQRILALEKENAKLRAMLADSTIQDEPSTSKQTPSYIAALGIPASLKTLGRQASETSKNITLSTSKPVHIQDTSSGSKPFLGSSASSNSAATSLTMSSPKDQPTKEAGKFGLFKKSPSFGGSAISALTKVGTSFTPAGDSSPSRSYAISAVHPGNASRLNAPNEVQRSTSPSEISYAKHIPLRMPQGATPIVLGAASAGSPGFSKDLPGNFKPNLPSSLWKAGPLISTSSLYPEHNTKSPPTYKKEPFLILSKDIFQEHHSSVMQCKFDNTGTTIASVENQGVVKVWQNEPVIKSLATLVMHNPVQCLEWSSKPTDTLLLGTSNGMIRFFDVAKNTSIRDVTIEDVHCCLTCMRTHPSGTSFVSSSVNPSESKHQTAWTLGTLTIWDITTSRGKQSRKLVGHSSFAVTCMDYNHNGNLLATGDISGCITLFDMKTCAVIHSRQAHDGPVSFVQFSTDETLVFSFGADNELMAWNINYLMKEPLKFHFAKTAGQSPSSESSTQPHLVLSPDGNHALASLGSKGLIYEISTSTQSLKHVLSLPEQKSQLTALDWIASKACGHCLTGTSDGRIQVTTLLMQS